MSKFGITIGLILSAILHAWLFRYGINPNQTANAQPLDNLDPAIATVDIAKLAEPEQLPKPQIFEDDQLKLKPEEKQTPLPVEVPELANSGKKQTTTTDTSGDFAGTSDGIAEPVVRINWGRIDNAVSVLNTSGMKLVIYESTGSVKKQVVIDRVVAAIKPLHLDSTISYSDNLRIVDNVPAFAAIRNSLKISPSDRLAVLIPVDVERVIESAKIAEVSKRSLSLTDVKVLGGRFILADGKLNFIIEKVLLRS